MMSKMVIAQVQVQVLGLRPGEKQLNTFDLRMLEDIILSIAKKELNAITWLGGVLGFLIGLFTLVF